MKVVKRFFGISAFAGAGAALGVYANQRLNRPSLHPLISEQRHK